MKAANSSVYLIYDQLWFWIVGYTVMNIVLWLCLQYPIITLIIDSISIICVIYIFAYTEYEYNLGSRFNRLVIFIIIMAILNRILTTTKGLLV